MQVSVVVRGGAGGGAGAVLDCEQFSVICQKRLKRLLAETALVGTARDHGPASRR